MQHFQSRYAQRFNKRHGRVGHLFQGRFKSVIVEREAYLLELCRYIVLNPVRAGIVERPEDYRWSSYRAKIGLEKPPEWLCMDSLALFGSDAKTARQEYKAFVEAAIGVADDLMAKVVGQIVLGTAEFVATVQELIDSEERSTEHPRFQREVGRPPLDAIMTAVAEKMDVTEEEIRTNRGALCRMIYARLGWWEGLRTLREIARELGLRSAGHVSNLVKRCRRECERDPFLRQLFDECIARARQHAPPLPQHYRA